MASPLGFSLSLALLRAGCDLRRALHSVWEVGVYLPALDPPISQSSRGDTMTLSPVVP